MYIGLEETQQDFPTPPWLREHCAQNGGGWAVALQVGAAHPTVVDPWPCFKCGDPVKAEDWIVPMPWHGGRDAADKPRWICEHRECFVAGILTDKTQLVECRPPNYVNLTAAQQWEIDKRLGLLDYDPSLAVPPRKKS